MSKQQADIDTAQENDLTMNAIDLLIQDHRMVESLFDQLKDATKNDEKYQLFLELYEEIDSHAKVEERIFYPALHAKDLPVLEAVEEHAIVKQCLASLNILNFNQDYNEIWDSKLTVLEELVKHHVEEEEKEVFKIARENLSAEELNELGSLILEMQEIVIMDWDGEETEEDESQTT